MRTEDGYIVSKCINGESEAFGLLVDKYKGGIYAFVVAKLLNSGFFNFHDAQDVTQEIFIKAYEKLRSLRRWDSFLSWLYCIANTQCKIFLRRQASRPDREFIEDQDHSTLKEFYTDPSREEPMLELLHEALDSLPEAHRQILMLYYLGGMNGAEIARFLRISPGSVWQRLSRARSKLKGDLLATMDTAFEGQKLQAGFTIRVVGIVRRIRMHPVPGNPGLPWGISVAAGIILIALGLSTHPDVPNPLHLLVDLSPPSQMEVAEDGDIPVDLLNIAHMPTTLRGDDNMLDAPRPTEQAVLTDPDVLIVSNKQVVKGNMFPEKPTMRLGKVRTSTISYSPDGSLLAVVAGADIELYDSHSLDKVGLLQGHTDNLESVAFSPDGRILASGSWDTTVRLWDVQEQEQIGVLRGYTTAVDVVAFSPDGKTLALCVDNDNRVHLWDVQKQKLIGLLQGHTDRVRAIAFSPDGRTLASCVNGDNRVYLWDFQRQELIGLLQGQPSIYNVAFSPDGKTLASGCSRVVYLWDVYDQRQVGTLQGQNGINTVAFSPDGKLLASNGTGAVRLWDIRSRRQIGVFQLNTGNVSVAGTASEIALSPSGGELAWLHNGTVHFWDIQRQRQVGVLKGYASSLHPIFSPDSRLLTLGGDDGAIDLWDIQRQEKAGSLRGNTNPANFIAFSPDGKTLASCHFNIQDGIILWDVNEQKQIGTLKTRDFMNYLAFISKEVLISSHSNPEFGFLGPGPINFWDIQRRELIESWQIEYSSNEGYSIASSPDGRLLASVVSFAVQDADSPAIRQWPRNGEIRLWDIQEKKLLSILPGRCYRAVFSPDGRFLLASGPGAAHLWDVQRQEQVGIFQARRICHVAFSPDGKLLASDGIDKAIYLWDVSEQRQVGMLKGHETNIYYLAFSPDGKWLVSQSVEGVVLLWEVNTQSGK